jgi:hypothetical protein
VKNIKITGCNVHNCNEATLDNEAEEGQEAVGKQTN